MSETPRMDHDHDRDEQLSAIYRAAPPDAPPPALDEAIRAAARRAVGARPRAAGASFAARWQMPLSVAAVLVLCVSLVAVMRDEGGELTQVPRADAPAPAASARNTAESAGAVAKIDLAPEQSQSKNIGLKPPALPPGSPASGADRYSLATPGSSIGIRGGAAELGQEAKRSAEPQAADTVPRRAPPSAFADKAEMASADAGAPNAAKANARRDAASEAPPAVAVAESRGRIPAEGLPAPAVGKVASVVEPATVMRQQSADRMERDTRAAVPPESQPVARPAAPPVVAQTRAEPIAAAKPAPAPSPSAKPAPAIAPPRALEKSSKEFTEAVEQMALLSPDKWLARIEELRRLGRSEEARAGLAEFRKRCPDYALPPALRDWAQP